MREIAHEAILRHEKLEGSFDRLVYVRRLRLSEPERTVGNWGAVPFDLCRGTYLQGGYFDSHLAAAAVFYRYIRYLQLSNPVRPHEDGENLHHGPVGIQWIGPGF